MMTRLRAAAFKIAFWGGSVPIVLCAPIAALFGTQPLRHYVHFWVSYHAWCARVIAGIAIRIEGRPHDGPALYAGKHQAMFETLELTRMLHEPVVVMKRELADIPIWGWTAKRYGMIVVDRQGSAAALRAMLRAAHAAAAEGRSVVIFPEGTRVPPGEAPPLKAGFAGLYRALDLPVVAIALDSGHVWPRHGPMRRGTVTMRFGEPIAPGLPRAAIEAAVHDGINAL